MSIAGVLTFGEYNKKYMVGDFLLFGSRVKELREKMGISQRDLSKMIQLSPSTVAMYELDQRSPDKDTLIKLANLFDVTTDYLLGRTDDPRPGNSRSSALSAWLKNFTRIMKSQRGAATSENTLQLLMEMAQLYAVSKGVPPSVIANQLSRVNEFSDKEKARLADEINGILQEEPSPADKLAKEIEGLPEKERQAIEAMLEVLKNRNNDAAAQES